MNAPTHTFEGGGYVDYDAMNYDDVSVVYHVIKDNRRHHVVYIYSTTTHLLTMYVNTERLIRFKCDEKTFHKQIQSLYSDVDHVVGLYIYNRILSEKDIKMSYELMETLQ